MVVEKSEQHGNKHLKFRNIASAYCGILGLSRA